MQRRHRFPRGEPSLATPTRWTASRDEFPLPTLTDNVESARGNALYRCSVRLYTVLDILCTDRSRTDSRCPRTASSALPRRGVVLAFPVIDYPLVSIKKIGFPVCLLDASIQLTQLFSQIVRFALNSGNAHRADKFDL